MSDSISDSMSDSTSESLRGGLLGDSPQEGGFSMGSSYTMIALGISCSTILLNCCILIMIIHQKSNC
jgi:hypothetical protein